MALWDGGTALLLSPGVSSGVSYYRNWIDTNIG